ncbi:DUF4181 domain-containing protein [Psychrobacillus psychrodurans]|uniref:DUF4181 domain-containing protein n=1 Tax=Psychrobacillus psychrodurans TaxID=126157 RepID=A0A9X3LCR0_9BACI|nr:DUF4181 domain-containing protein [Psychrobacillus psychrodurans]MCZ8535392.1 DUF4181 domain-containing protein [Psychrobacillus psychrodurans]
MFWIKFGLIVIIVFVIISIVKLLLRNLLKIDKVKKEFFSFNYINELHRKIDKGLRIFSAITLITLSFVMFFYYEDLIYLTLIAVIVFMVLDYMVRAFFEWKYTQYPKQSILTLSEMFLILIAIIIVFEFKLLNPLLS